MGGGLTRGLGFLFVVLALGQAHAMFTTGRRGSVVVCALCSGLAVLSHPAMVWFLAFSAGSCCSRLVAACVSCVCLDRRRRSRPDRYAWAFVALQVNRPGCFSGGLCKRVPCSSVVPRLSPTSSDQFLAIAGLIAGIVVCLVMAASRHRGLFMLAPIGLIVLLAPRELTRVTILPLSLAAAEIAGRAGGIRLQANPTIRARVPLRRLVRRWGGWAFAGVVALALGR